MKIDISCALALGFIGALISSAAAAETVTIGSQGAVYCKNTEDLGRQITTVIAGSRDIVPGCGMLPAGTVVDAAAVKKSDGVIGGLGTAAGILGGAPFAFVTVPEDDKSSASAPRQSTSSDLAAAAATLESATDPVRVSGADLSVQTHKWVGKVIETKANCFYADVNEFRCFSARFRVDFEKVFPPSAQSVIERECDTISKAERRACTLVLRFEYVDYQPMDVPGFVGRINVVRARDNVGFVVKK